MMRSSCALMLMLCLLVLHCQRVRAVRAKPSGMATELSSAGSNGTHERFDIKKCLPHPLPIIDMKMCLHATTDGILEPLPPGLFTRFLSLFKKKPFDAEKHIKSYEEVVLADKDDLPELATFSLQPALFGCDRCKNDLLSNMATKTHTEEDESTAYPYLPLMNVERKVKRGARDPLSPHCTDVVNLAEKAVEKMPTIKTGLAAVKALIKTSTKGASQKGELRSQYCVYMAEHKFNSQISVDFAGNNSMTITFQEDEICIDHLWSIALAYDGAELYQHALISPSPLMCWSRDEVKKNGFNEPAVPWLSEKYQGGLAGVVDGLTDLLTGCFTKSDIRGKVTLANKWCEDNGARKFEEIIENKKEFVDALGLDSGETDQMGKRFELAVLLSECFDESEVAKKLKLANAWCNEVVYEVNDVNGIIDHADDFMEALQLKGLEMKRMGKKFEALTLRTESADKRV